jgi:hypothetical protein
MYFLSDAIILLHDLTYSFLNLTVAFLLQLLTLFINFFHLHPKSHFEFCSERRGSGALRSTKILLDLKFKACYTIYSNRGRHVSMAIEFSPEQLARGKRTPVLRGCCLADIAAERLQRGIKEATKRWERVGRRRIVQPLGDILKKTK